MERVKKIYHIPQIHKRFVIPLAICQFTAKADFIDELQLFLYLKSICNGHLTVDRKIISAAAAFLDCHPKTIKRRLARLKDRNWIGTFTDGKLILRKFNELFRVEGIKPFRTGVEFEIHHLFKIRAFVVGACIGYLSKYLRIKERALQSGVRILTPHPAEVTLPFFYPVACKYISECLGIAISTASEWKQLGEEAGFIQVEKQFSPCLIRNPKEYQKYGGEDGHRIVFREGQYYFQETDLIAPNLRYKTCKSFTPSQKKSGQLPKHNNLDKNIGVGSPSLYRYEFFMNKRHQK